MPLTLSSVRPTLILLHVAARAARRSPGRCGAGRAARRSPARVSPIFSSTSVACSALPSLMAMSSFSRFSCMPGVVRPTMPRSSSTRWPSSVRKRLPGCGSAWKRPSTSTCLRYALKSCSASSPPSISMRASGAERRDLGARHVLHGEHALGEEVVDRLRARRGGRSPRGCAASPSGSAPRARSRARASPTGAAPRRSRQARRAAHSLCSSRNAAICAMHLEIVGDLASRCWGAAPSPPPRGRRAAWRGGPGRARRRRAAAGRSSRTPSRCARRARPRRSACASASENGFTRSCRRASAWMYASGMRSGRPDSTCPSFTKVGPIASRSSASCSAVALSVVVAGWSAATASSTPSCFTRSERPYFHSNRTICW